MVNHEKFSEETLVEANQDDLSKSEAMPEKEASTSDENNVESAQASEAPTWAEAEIEETDNGETSANADAQSADTEKAAAPSSADQEIAALSQEISVLKAQLEERTSQYMRIAADFDNFRKRTQKEREDMEQQIKCNTITELLPVVDNFERARSQIKPQSDAEMTIHKSYQSVYKQFVDCLKRLGVSPMRAEGTEFDPNLHEAVMREPTNEYPEGTVIEELMRGYTLGDRVLRHAMVKVATEAEPVIASSEDNQDSAET